MPETDLVSCVIRLQGWFDTGRTNVTLVVHRTRCDLSLPIGRALQEGETLYHIEAEVFMDEMASELIASKIMKALSTYETAMCLP